MRFTSNNSLAALVFFFMLYVSISQALEGHFSVTVVSTVFWILWFRLGKYEFKKELDKPKDM